MTALPSSWTASRERAPYVPASAILPPPVQMIRGPATRVSEERHERLILER